MENLMVNLEIVIWIEFKERMEILMGDLEKVEKWIVNIERLIIVGCIGRVENIMVINLWEGVEKVMVVNKY